MRAIGVWRRIVLLSLLAACGASAAQEVPQPGPEYKELDFWTGTWRFEGMMEPSPFGPGGELEGTDTCSWYGSFAVVCDSEGTTGGEKNEKSFTVLSYGVHEKAYTLYGVGGGLSPVFFVGSKDDEIWTYYEATDRMARLTMTVLSPDSYRLLFEISTDGESWTKVLEGKSRRVGGNP